MPPLGVAEEHERNQTPAGERDRVELEQHKDGHLDQRLRHQGLEAFALGEDGFDLKSKGTLRYERDSTNLPTLPATHLLLHPDHHKLHEERHVVAAVESVPNGQEEQRPKVAQHAVVQELEPLVHVHGDPVVRLHVERLDVVAKLAGVLEHAHLDVGAAGQLVRVVLAVTGLGVDVGETWEEIFF